MIENDAGLTFNKSIMKAAFGCISFDILGEKQNGSVTIVENTCLLRTSCGTVGTALAGVDVAGTRV